MKILMVISQFHPMIGGVEKQAQLLAKKLIEEGVSVDIVTGFWNVKTSRKEIIDGINVFRNFCGWGMFGKENHRMIRMLRGIIYAMSLGVYLFLHGRKYDIIHVHQFLYPAFVSVIIGKRALKKPVIVKSASSGLTSDIEQLRQLPLGHLQVKVLLRELNYLVAVSQATARDFIKVGYSESQISYIPNGVEIPASSKTACNKDVRVITIARLSLEKGVDVLLKAWAEVVREERSLKLLIVGYGSLDSSLKSLSRSLGISESIDFVGLAKNISNYLEASDVFVLSSRSEGMSNALLEAMSYGIPCIATNVGGNCELLGGEKKEIPLGGYIIAKNGLLVNPDDVKGLSEAIFYFIRNERVREELGKRARRFIQENYSIDLIADQYIALYQRMLDRKSLCAGFAER
jgi:glycosyltransferase involved in cell wall biosynthesis